jgi:hypothetical protein
LEAYVLLSWYCHTARYLIHLFPSPLRPLSAPPPRPTPGRASPRCYAPSVRPQASPCHLPLHLLANAQYSHLIITISLHSHHSIITMLLYYQHEYCSSLLHYHHKQSHNPPIITSSYQHPPPHPRQVANPSRRGCRAIRGTTATGGPTRPTSR